MTVDDCRHVLEHTTYKSGWKFGVDAHKHGSRLWCQFKDWTGRQTLYGRPFDETALTDKRDLLDKLYDLIEDIENCSRQNSFRHKGRVYIRGGMSDTFAMESY
jgi:hypothetical protein